MNVILGVSHSEATENAFNWIKYNNCYFWNKSNLHLTLVHVLSKNQSGSGVMLLRKYEAKAKNFAATVTTKLLNKQKSVGQTLKEFATSLRQPMLVIGCTGNKWKTIDYCVQRCECPVMIVKRDYTNPYRTRPVLALAMDVNVHCDRTFSWLLRTADLPETSQLYVVHITPKKTDKPDARRFLAALKPKCLESKRMYSMASALVSYDKGGVADGIIRFSHDKDVETLIFSSKGDRGLPSKLRLKTPVIEDCLRRCNMDVLIWQDELTRTVPECPYIHKIQGPVPSIPLATWDNSSKIPQGSIESGVPQKLSSNTVKTEVNQKVKASTVNTEAQQVKPRKSMDNNRKSMDNENSQRVKPSTSTDNSNSETKSKKSQPHPPSYPRPSLESSENSNEFEKPLAPIAESYTCPVSDISSKQRRKSSLKYSFYDSLAKGKKEFARYKNDDADYYLEPLSP